MQVLFKYPEPVEEEYSSNAGRQTYVSERTNGFTDLNLAFTNYELCSLGKPLNFVPSVFSPIKW